MSARPHGRVMDGNNRQEDMFVRSSVTALAILLASSGLANAQSPTRIEQFKAWGAYSYKSNGGTVCYVLSVPTTKEPASVNHGDIFFVVSQRPGQNISYEPQAMMGYPMKGDSKVNVKIDNKNFVLFVKDTSAWVENAAEEPALVAAMKGGSSMTVTATIGSWHRHQLHLFAVRYLGGSAEDPELQLGPNA